MKKVLKSFICLMFILMLTGCSLFSAKPKEFSGNGMTVTLTSDFSVGKNVQVPFYVASDKHIFMGANESKSLLASNGYRNLTLEQYAELVIYIYKKNVKINTYQDDETEFVYAYYDSTVSGVSYSYMMVCMEGDDSFYTMNFACFTKNFDDSTKELYMKWAKTIRVE